MNVSVHLIFHWLCLLIVSKKLGNNKNNWKYVEFKKLKFTST
jgi:hypothetical protein